MMRATHHDGVLLPRPVDEAERRDKAAWRERRSTAGRSDRRLRGKNDLLDADGVNGLPRERGGRHHDISERGGPTMTRYSHHQHADTPELRDEVRKTMKAEAND
jgi:hypothetical protein